jgi:uncharacterized protein (UPF0548 family)
MMFPTFRKPSPAALRRYLARQEGRRWTYREVGGTAAQPPAGYVIDHTRVCLGEGDDAYAAARAALESWRQFELGWLEPAEPPSTIGEGAVVAILARLMGVWWWNACRVVYVIDEQSPLPRFGFAYGTLPGHVERGEERFLVEMDQQGRVWYDVLAFSRPGSWLARVGYPYVRRVQKRFGRDSSARMLSTVASALRQVA